MKASTQTYPVLPEGRKKNTKAPVERSIDVYRSLNVYEGQRDDCTQHYLKSIENKIVPLAKKYLSFKHAMIFDVSNNTLFKMYVHR